MKILVNKNWRKVLINCDGNILEVNDIIYPLYDDYFLKQVSEFKINEDTIELKNEVSEYWLFSGTKGDYIYLDYVDGRLELWGTDGDDSNFGLDCYAIFKDGKWNILV